VSWQSAAASEPSADRQTFRECWPAIDTDLHEHAFKREAIDETLGSVHALGAWWPAPFPT
jgi:hypothetical protein